MELERWVAAHNTPQQVSQRCQIVLAASQGQPDKDIAIDLEIDFKTAALWSQAHLNTARRGESASSVRDLIVFGKWLKSHLGRQTASGASKGGWGAPPSLSKKPAGVQEWRGSQEVAPARPRRRVIKAMLLLQMRLSLSACGPKLSPASHRL